MAAEVAGIRLPPGSSRADYEARLAVAALGATGHAGRVPPAGATGASRRRAPVPTRGQPGLDHRACRALVRRAARGHRRRRGRRAAHAGQALRAGELPAAVGAFAAEAARPAAGCQGHDDLAREGPRGPNLARPAVRKRRPDALVFRAAGRGDRHEVGRHTQVPPGPGAGFSPAARGLRPSAAEGVRAMARGGLLHPARGRPADAGRRAVSAGSGGGAGGGGHCGAVAEGQGHPPLAPRADRHGAARPRPQLPGRAGRLRRPGGDRRRAHRHRQQRVRRPTAALCLRGRAADRTTRARRSAGKPVAARDHRHRHRRSLAHRTAAGGAPAVTGR